MKIETQTLATKIDGVDYHVVMIDINGAPSVRPMMARKQANGEVVWSLLSHRQNRMKSRVMSRFASEIAKFKAQFN